MEAAVLAIVVSGKGDGGGCRGPAAMARAELYSATDPQA